MRLVRLPQAKLGGSFGLGQPRAGILGRPVVIKCRWSILLQIEDSSQKNVRPGYHLRFMRDFQCAFEVIAGTLHI